MSHKILPLADLGAKTAELRAAGKTVVLCHGTFDLIHIGHIRHLQMARSEGDLLVVTITADAYVSKGPGRPVFTEALRLENLAALECVDYAAVVHEATAIAAIETVRPNVYVKGGEYRNAADDLTGNIAKETNAVTAGGGRTVYTDDITFSSSKLLNEYMVFSPQVKKYLSEFRGRWSADDLIAKIKGLSGMRVCVVGDAIIDEYHYTDPMGQTGKSNIMAGQFTHMERFAGGSFAVANHLAGFCEQVTLVSGLGRKNSHEAFIREKLKTNVDPVFFFREDAATLVKSRFVDQDANKLFEVYYYDDSPHPPELEQEITQWLAANLGQYDAVIVPDFGNGFISRKMIEVLCEKAPYLAVNTQINSGNRGYHTINRYARADYISLNEPELRLAVHNRVDNIEDLALRVASKLGASHIATTLGTRGLNLCAVEGASNVHVPALSIKVVDRIGAGDAFLSLSALCLAGGVESEASALIGAAAAAIGVQIVCNRSFIEPTSLYKYLVTLLK